MPELPDLTVYLESLEARIANRRLLRVRLLNPFLLRTAVPPITAVEGKKVLRVGRVGKRIVIELEAELYLVLHLMVAGRLRWDAKPPKRITLALFEFDSGTLAFTEAGTKRRASLHLVHGQQALHAMDAGGIEILDCDLEKFRAVLFLENHTLKRALTDPRLFAGIGNAYSDEILHRARLSPNVTAFREGMAVHGRYGKPCPACGAPVQRIVYAENETNYCARCQTGGRILADRALSRLLKKSWPRSIDELG